MMRTSAAPDLTTRIIAGVGYFAVILGFPVLIPLVIWIAAAHLKPANDLLVYHAKRAFKLQLWPIVAWLVVAAVLLISDNSLSWPSSWLPLVVIGLAILLSLYFFLYNLVLGVQVLLARDSD